VTKGKPWTPKQEKDLRRLVEAKEALDVIAVKLDKSPEAIRKKIERLGLEVVDHRGLRTTTSLEIPEELPTVEETLKMLASALNAAMLPGLEKVDVQRLQTVATIARTYKDIFSDYVDYRGIEAELVELRMKYEELVKKIQNPAAN
jgi:maleate cis-trans isomerase